MRLLIITLIAASAFGSVMAHLAPGGNQADLGFHRAGSTQDAMNGSPTAAPYASPASWPRLSTVPALDGFTTATYMTSIVTAADGSDRLFVTEQGGLIHRLDRTAGDWGPAAVFMDIRDRVAYGDESGLFSIAFSPNFPTRNEFYVKYVASTSDVVISRFRTVKGNPDQGDASSEQVVLVVEQPPFPNHKGGTIAFGGDGMMYIGTGDGGYQTSPEGPGDPMNYAQDPASLLGKMLRIDVESGNPLTYTIPVDNPFVSLPGYRPELWATGLRNPWRFSFDRVTNDLYIGDVGHRVSEEIHVLPAAAPAGANLGWSCFEGEYLYKTCRPGDYLRPESVYLHDGPCGAVIGGDVYRGSRSVRMAGMYLYGDLCTHRLYAMRLAGSIWQSAVVGTAPLFTTFGADRDGELYVAGNTLFRIVDAAVEPIVTPTPTHNPFRALYLPAVER